MFGDYLRRYIIKKGGRSKGESAKEKVVLNIYIIIIFVMATK